MEIVLSHEILPIRTSKLRSANSGIGKEITTYVAAKGAKVYMICRSKGRAEKARDEIIQATSSSTDKVKVLLVRITYLFSTEFVIVSERI